MKQSIALVLGYSETTTVPLIHQLCEQGYLTITRPASHDIQESLKKDRPHIVFVDEYAFQTHIGKWNAHTPLIMLTEKNDSPSSKEWSKQGISAVLSMPADEIEVANLMKKHGKTSLRETFRRLFR